MKKFMSLFLILTMVLICSVPAFATFSDNAGETIIIDGSQYTIEQVVTDTYSQAIVRDSSTKVVENFIYYFDNSTLVNALTNQTIPTHQYLPDRGAATEQWLHFSCAHSLLISHRLVPRHLNFPMIVRAIPQIEIDKGLIRDSIYCRHRLKIIQRAPFNINSNLYLARVRIFTWIQFSDIILVPHS